MSAVPSNAEAAPAGAKRPWWATLQWPLAWRGWRRRCEEAPSEAVDLGSAQAAPRGSEPVLYGPGRGSVCFLRPEECSTETPICGIHKPRSYDTGTLLGRFETKLAADEARFTAALDLLRIAPPDSDDYAAAVKALRNLAEGRDHV